MHQSPTKVQPSRDMRHVASEVIAKGKDASLHD